MQMPALDDTIIAVSTGWQAAPLGILRLSGPDAFRLTEQLGVTLPRPADQPRSGWCAASLELPGQFNLPATVYWFRAPRSYTGQDVAEIHTVGSLPALRAISTRLLDLGARRALPGEFTARAYLNGQLDADQVDGVLALISAQDRTAARHAVRLSRESQRPRVEALSGRLIGLIADVEAGIDFVDEEDVRFITAAELSRSIDELVDKLAAVAQPGRDRDHSSRPHVALAGLPNAGKSTLFNALLGHERAIVTPVLGTTRDVLSAEIQLDDVAAVLQDCAGLGSSTDELESAAHLAAERAADQADLVLWLHERNADWKTSELQACRRVPRDRRVLVFSKCDRPAERGSPPPLDFAATVETSAVTGAGLSDLRRLLAARLESFGEPPAGGITTAHLGPALPARRRARRLLSQADQAVEMPELVALELRQAWESLQLTERGPLANEVLETILSRFCIGK